MLKTKKLVIFKLNEQNFGIDIVSVNRIIDFTDCTSIPESFSYVEGVIGNQGKILPIINLKKRFNLGNTSINSDSKIIVLTKQNKFTIGIIVDSVSEIDDITESDFEVSPEITKNIDNTYIDGFIKTNGAYTTVINMKFLEE